MPNPKTASKGGAADFLKKLHAEHESLIKTSDGQFMNNKLLVADGAHFYITAIKSGEGQFGPKYNLSVRFDKPCRSYWETKDDNHRGSVQVRGKPVDTGIVSLSASEYRDAFFGDIVTKMNWTFEPDVEESGEEFGPVVLVERGKMFDLASPNVETNDGDEQW